ncbi:VanZ family protein [Prauserella shujinwangii]|nr:VanZ family protein [Prauserella shujinwangii]
MSVPFAVVAWRLLRRRRSRTRPLSEASATAALDVAIVTIAGLVVALVALPVPGPGGVHPVPGTDLATALANGGSFLQVTGNVLLLLPLGALLPARWPWWRPLRRTTGAALSASIAIELAQYLFAAGRVASTDDVLLNTVGAAAGVTLVRSGAGLRWYPRPLRLARSLPVLDTRYSTRIPVPDPVGRTAK